MKPERGEAVFLVRMWQRDGDAAPDAEWRGSVHEVATGIRFYVSDARDVAEFIAGRLAEKSETKAPAPPGGSRSNEGEGTHP